MKNASPWLLAFFVGIFLANILELLVFFHLDKIDAPYVFPLFIVYYMTLIFAFFSLFAYSIEVGGMYQRHRVYRLVYCICYLVCVAFLVRGVVIQGIESIGYLLTRIAGPYYIIAQFGLIAPLIGTVVVCSYFTKNARSALQKRKSKALLICTLPVIILFCTVIFLMALKVKINATSIFTVGICITLWGLIYIESHHQLFKFMTFVPGSNESKMIDLVKQAYMNPIQMKDCTKMFESNLVHIALENANGNK